MTRHSSRSRRSDEHGATLVIFTLVLVALITMVALVLDLSVLRSDRKSNKSAADQATAAGLEALQAADDGVPRPWQGICEAYRFVLANRPEVSPFDSEDWLQEDGQSVIDVLGLPGHPCTQTPAKSPMYDLLEDVMCDPADGSSPLEYGTFRGEADGGRIVVEIKSGYRMPDAAFADGASDNGDPAQQGCDHIAVIISETQPPGFSAVIGQNEKTTRVRTVGRVQIEDPDEEVAALVLLEQHDCEVLEIQGTEPSVRVAGVGATAGRIHSDSVADGANCSTAGPNDGKIFQVNSGSAVLAIIADHSVTPVGGEAPGIISSYALRVGANPALISAPVPTQVCAAQVASDCTPPTISGGAPIAGDEVTRSPVDERYRTPGRILKLRDDAADRFAWASAADLPAGWVEMPCGGPVPAAATHIWVNCGGGNFTGNGMTFGTGVREVVINGYLVLDAGGTLRFDSPDRVFLKGTTTPTNPDAHGLFVGGTGTQLLVNLPSGVTDGNGDGFLCDDRRAADSSAVTQFVIGNGAFTAQGGEKTIRMCGTFVFMMDNDGNSCPIPTTDGADPYDNQCEGRFRVAGSASLDWSAPNQNNVTDPTPAELDKFEDLAFWTETSSGVDVPDARHTIEGGGNVRLSGVFFTPNANPFRLAGSGTGHFDITQAQFFTRKLEVAGNKDLTMAPNPVNAIAIPSFSGSSLVR